MLQQDALTQLKSRFRGAIIEPGDARYDEARAVYNAMIAMPYPIITHNIGNVDSIANVIFLAGGTRYACGGSNDITGLTPTTDQPDYSFWAEQLLALGYEMLGSGWMRINFTGASRLGECTSPTS